ncbi:cytoplasmic protein [Salmonella enterica subsp. enterica]|uniref:Cytoplasmic protein n=1 Tax=Salmonella enterica I TaxID=59201 RepID=A0A3S5DMG6_SALET|nr:cytoplasmic protein [Salmonella enterica subsp. enterica]
MSSVPWFKSTLMNMVLRDLSGWRCEKLTEHSAVLYLNAFTPGYLPCSAKNGYSWPVFTVVNSG